MAEYTASISWKRNIDEHFLAQKYSRAHRWEFDGGAIIDASPSPHIVPAPYSVESHVDPEEAFVASLSSCHMLFFLQIAAQKKFIVDEYIDHAFGTMGKNSNGKISMTSVKLRPKVTFSSGSTPSLSELETMHEMAHEKCFIANSVNTQVLTEIVQ